jgi:RNA polymerase-binding transcription factor DksA
LDNPTYLNHYRRLLLLKKRELLATNGGRLVLGAAGRLAGDDLMDQARAESEVMVDASLSEARSSQRRAIEWALVRLKKGSYGICAACGNPITRARLKAVPWTAYCRNCMEQEGDRF